MDIAGTQKIKAPRQQVFSALLNPEVLQESIPGCENATLVDIGNSQQLKLKISPSIPGLKGPYVVFLQARTQSAAPNADSIIYSADPKSSSMGSITATCVVDVTDAPEGTLLTYNAHAEMEGKIAATPDIVLKGALKMALGQFFKNFEKQVSTIPA